MRHRGLGDDDEDGYELHELEGKLTELFGGDLWRAWKKDVAMPGAELYAGYSRTETGYMVLTGLVLLGDALTTDLVRKVPVVALENSINLSRDDVAAEARKLPPLERTEGMTPEEFSQLVATHFKTWARGVPHPAAAMAAESGVKLATVHTWIREARFRGLLPPAKRGKGSRKESDE